MALVLDPPLSHEVDGLRRAVGDPSLARIKPHLTLVPPVNIRVEDTTAAIERLRTAAATQSGPLCLTLGSIATFVPANPVLFLSVGGDLERLQRLRDAIFTPPFERELSWPWVPHVTVGDGIDETRIEAALTALGAYSALATIDRIVLLEQQPGRVWTELADAALERRAVIGTGGLALQITRGRVVDPDVGRMLEEAVGSMATLEADAGSMAPEPSWPPIVMTARREGDTVGVAAAAGPDASFVFVRPDVRDQGIGGHLRRHLDSAIRRLRPRTGPASSAGAGR